MRNRLGKGRHLDLLAIPLDLWVMAGLCQLPQRSSLFPSFSQRKALAPHKGNLKVPKVGVAEGIGTKTVNLSSAEPDVTAFTVCLHPKHP